VCSSILELFVGAILAQTWMCLARVRKVLCILSLAIINASNQPVPRLYSSALQKLKNASGHTCTAAKVKHCCLVHESVGEQLHKPGHAEESRCRPSLPRFESAARTFLKSRLKSHGNQVCV